MKRLALLLLAIIATSSAFAGPFGLEMGMTFDQLKAIDPGIADKGNGIYRISVVPAPSKAFEFFDLYIHPKLGLRKLVAIGADIKTNRFGNTLMLEFERVNAALSQQYGAPRQFNFLQTGSIWKGPEDWMMALLKDERVLASFWMKGSFDSESVESISLVTIALSTEKGYILIEYEFKGFSEIVNDFKAKEQF